MNLEQFKSSVSYFIRNSERVQEAVNTLQEELKRLQEQFCSSLEEDKLQTLIQADGVSKKLEETLDLLRHAKEAQEVIDRSETWQKTTDWEALGIAIRSLRTSLKYLKEVPQYSEFEGHLQVLTKRFQELIRPQLYEYLSNRDSNSLQNIWSHCEEIGQKDVFIDIWVSERSSFIQKLWSNCWKDYFAQYGTEWDFSGQRQGIQDIYGY